MVQPKRFLPSSGEEEGERVKRQNSGDTRPRSRRLCSEDEEYTTDETSEDEEESAPTAVARKSKPPRRWQPSEDRRLAESVKQHGEANWKAIAAKVGSRNHVQCLQRWKKVLRPGLVKGQWSAEEDAMLMKLASSGYKNWGVLSNHMPGRTSKQCRERWCHHLDPSINKGAYTPAEDKIIIEMQAKIGNKWSQIAARLPGRTENSIKIRCKALQRKGTGGGSRSSKARRRQYSSSSIRATSGVSAVDSAIEQQLSEGGDELPEDLPSSPQTNPRSCPPHLPAVDKFELMTKPSSETSCGQPQQLQIFSQTTSIGETPSSNAAASFSERNDSMGVATSVSSSAGVLIPPAMPIPRHESVNKRWMQWPKTSTVLDGTMHHSGIFRGWPPNPAGEATAMPVKQELELQRLPCLSSAMDQHLIDRPASCATGDGGGIAPFDGTTVPNAGFPGSSSCGDFEQAPLGQYFTPGLNTSASMQQETVSMSPELTSVEQACGIPNPAPGAEMVLSARPVEFCAVQPVIPPEKERVGASFGDFNALSLEDLKAAVGGDEDDAAVPLRSCCSFLDLPDVVGDMPLSW